MNRMGFISVKKVEKSKPLKKISETNAIFNQLAVANEAAHPQWHWTMISLAPW